MNYEKDIAVFGGAFDPPTKAHEAIMEACLSREDIDEVWVMPSGQRTDKSGMSDDETRLRMLEIVRREQFNSDQRLVVSDFELQLPRPTQTYLTSQALASAYPGARFWYVFGADSFDSMETWEDGVALKQTIGMLLIPRVGYVLPEGNNRIRCLAVENATQNISSTGAREAIRNGKDADKYISSAVQQFILEHALYDCDTISR